MMKLILEQQHEIDMAIKAPKYFNIIWEMDQYLRSRIKYDSNEEVVENTLQEVRNKLHEIMSEENINIYEG